MGDPKAMVTAFGAEEGADINVYQVAGAMNKRGFHFLDLLEREQRVPALRSQRVAPRAQWPSARHSRRRSRKG